MGARSWRKCRRAISASAARRRFIDPPVAAATAAPDTASSTLPPPIALGAQGAPPVVSSARDALERRARQLRKRAAETPSDDPRLTVDQKQRQ